MGDWALNPSSHSLDWTIPIVTPNDNSGLLEFTIGGDDPGAFFPVKASFVARGSVAGISVGSVEKVNGGEQVVFSTDSVVTTEDYHVI